MERERALGLNERRAASRAGQAFLGSQALGREKGEPVAGVGAGVALTPRTVNVSKLRVCSHCACKGHPVAVQSPGEATWIQKSSYQPRGEADPSLRCGGNATGLGDQAGREEEEAQGRHPRCGVGLPPVLGWTLPQSVEASVAALLPPTHTLPRLHTALRVNLKILP